MVCFSTLELSHKQFRSIECFVSAANVIYKWAKPKYSFRSDSFPWSDKPDSVRTKEKFKYPKKGNFRDVITVMTSLIESWSAGFCDSEYENWTSHISSRSNFPSSLFFFIWFFLRNEKKKRKSDCELFLNNYFCLLLLFYFSSASSEFSLTLLTPFSWRCLQCINFRRMFKRALWISSPFPSNQSSMWWWIDS